MVTAPTSAAPPETVTAEATRAAARVRVDAERVNRLREELEAAYADRLAAVRAAYTVIAAVGPAEFSRMIGNRPDGKPLLHDTQLISFTRDLRRDQVTTTPNRRSP